MTHYPPPQPGPPGPWDPQQPAVPYPAYPGYDIPQAPQYGAPPPPYGYQAPHQGYGIPPQGYPYPYPAPSQPGRGRVWLVVGAIAAVLIVAALVVGGVLLLRWDNTYHIAKDENEIQKLVEDFSATGNNGKFSDLGQYFCKAEAGMFGALGQLGEILQGMDVPGTVPSAEVTVTDILVKGDVASAHMDGGGPFGTAFFRKESGEWKLCMSAATEFNKQ